jgi:hypothetical protein|tara:strand:+ start:16 stop:912 length:897 start_codon:yes stop_codon:yes gene_type:complete
MKAQFDNQVMSSFLLWFDNKLLDKGEGFTNHSGLFYDMTDKWNFGDNYNVYNAPFKQFVYDTSINSATVMTGVTVTDSVDGQVSYNLDSAEVFAINPTEGQVILKTDEFAGNITQVSGSYAIKEFSVKLTSEPEEKLLFETDFKLKPKVTQTINTGLFEDQQSYPVIFLKHNGSVNNPGAFGGQEFTSIDIRAIVLTNSQFTLDGICSIFRDTDDDNFYLFDADEFPFNYVGSYNNDAVFNYSNTISGVNLGGPKGMYIKNVTVAKYSAGSLNDYKSINANIYAALIDFEVEKYRLPS